MDGHNKYLDLLQTKHAIIRHEIVVNNINPFVGIHNIDWFAWPIVMINSSGPPSLLIKKDHLILSLLISRKHKVKNMSAYLEPHTIVLWRPWDGPIYTLDLSKTT